jgi:hypothetical protein
MSLITANLNDDEEILDDLLREIKEERYEYGYLTNLELKYELEDGIELKHPNWAKLLSLVVEGAKRA